MPVCVCERIASVIFNRLTKLTDVSEVPTASIIRDFNKELFVTVMRPKFRIFFLILC